MTEEEYKNKLEKFDIALNDIHNEITTSRNINSNKFYYIFNRLILVLQYRVLLDEEHERMANNENNKMRNKLTALLMITLFLISLAHIFPNLLMVSILGLTFCLFKSKSMMDKCKELIKEGEQSKSRDKKDYSRLDNYCHILQEKLVKDEQMAMEVEKLYSQESPENIIGLANSFIDLNMNSEELIAPEHLKPIIIQILKDDLKMESDDLGELLRACKVKRNKENNQRKRALKF